MQQQGSLMQKEEQEEEDEEIEQNKNERKTKNNNQQKQQQQSSSFQDYMKEMKDAYSQIKHENIIEMMSDEMEGRNFLYLWIIMLIFWIEQAIMDEYNKYYQYITLSVIIIFTFIQYTLLSNQKYKYLHIIYIINSLFILLIILLWIHSHQSSYLTQFDQFTSSLIQQQQQLNYSYNNNSQTNNNNTIYIQNIQNIWDKSKQEIISSLISNEGRFFFQSAILFRLQECLNKHLIPKYRLLIYIISGIIITIMFQINDYNNYNDYNNNADYFKSYRFYDIIIKCLFFIGISILTEQYYTKRLFSYLISFSTLKKYFTLSLCTQNNHEINNNISIQIDTENINSCKIIQGNHRLSELLFSNESIRFFKEFEIDPNGISNYNTVGNHFDCNNYIHQYQAHYNSCAELAIAAANQQYENKSQNHCSESNHQRCQQNHRTISKQFIDRNIFSRESNSNHEQDQQQDKINNNNNNIITPQIVSLKEINRGMYEKDEKQGIVVGGVLTKNGITQTQMNSNTAYRSDNLLQTFRSQLDANGQNLSKNTYPNTITSPILGNTADLLKLNRKESNKNKSSSSKQLKNQSNNNNQNLNSKINKQDNIITKQTLKKNSDLSSKSDENNQNNNNKNGNKKNKNNNNNDVQLNKYDTLEDIIKDNKIRSVCIKGRFKYNKQYYLSVTLIKYYNIFQKETIILTISDTTQIQEINELQREVKFKETMFANVTHDLRTPLYAIKYSADKLKEIFQIHQCNTLQEQRKQIQLSIKNLYDNQIKDLHEQINITIANTHFIEAIIQDIIDNNRNRMGKLEADIRQFNLLEMLQEMNKLMEIILWEKRKNIKIKFDICKNIQQNAMIYSDSQRLKQVLMNLISNSIKFTKKGGILIKVSMVNIKNTNKVDKFVNPSLKNNLKTKINDLLEIKDFSINLNSKSQNNYNNNNTNRINSEYQQYQLWQDHIFQNGLIQFQIIDSGVGMNSKVLENLFTPYNTFNTNNMNNHGIGLGLTICKTIVEKLGPFSLKVASKEQRGSKFTFYIYHELSQSIIPQKLYPIPIDEQSKLKGINHSVINNNVNNNKLSSSQINQINNYKNNNNKLNISINNQLNQFSNNIFNDSTHNQLDNSLNNQFNDNIHHSQQINNNDDNNNNNNNNNNNHNDDDQDITPQIIQNNQLHQNHQDGSILQNIIQHEELQVISPRSYINLMPNTSECNLKSDKCIQENNNNNNNNQDKKRDSTSNYFQQNQKQLQQQENKTNNVHHSLQLSAFQNDRNHHYFSFNSDYKSKHTFQFKKSSLNGQHSFVQNTLEDFNQLTNTEIDKEQQQQHPSQQFKESNQTQNNSNNNISPHLNTNMVNQNTINHANNYNSHNNSFNDIKINDKKNYQNGHSNNVTSREDDNLIVKEAISIDEEKYLKESPTFLNKNNNNSFTKIINNNDKVIEKQIINNNSNNIIESNFLANQFKIQQKISFGVNNILNINNSNNSAQDTTTNNNYNNLTSNNNVAIIPQQNYDNNPDDMNNNTINTRQEPSQTYNSLRQARLTLQTQDYLLPIPSVNQNNSGQASTIASIIIGQTTANEKKDNEEQIIQTIQLNSQHKNSFASKINQTTTIATTMTNTTANTTPTLTQFLQQKQISLLHSQTLQNNNNSNNVNNNLHLNPPNNYNISQFDELSSHKLQKQNSPQMKPAQSVIKKRLQQDPKQKSYEHLKSIKSEFSEQNYLHSNGQFQKNQDYLEKLYKNEQSIYMNPSFEKFTPTATQGGIPPNIYQTYSNFNIKQQQNQYINHHNQQYQQNYHSQYQQNNQSHNEQNSESSLDEMVIEQENKMIDELYLEEDQLFNTSILLSLEDNQEHLNQDEEPNHLIKNNSFQVMNTKKFNNIHIESNNMHIDSNNQAQKSVRDSQIASIDRKGLYISKIDRYNHVTNHKMTESVQLNQIKKFKFGMDIIHSEDYLEKQKLNILICDDSEFNIKILTKFLLNNKTYKMSLDACYSGDEAIQKFRIKNKPDSQEPYNYIFLDWNMPIMDGYETSLKIKFYVKDESYLDCPIIICTAYEDTTEINKCLRSGTDGILTKPISQEQLNELLSDFQKSKESYRKQ